MNEQVNKWVNDTGSCNEIEVDREVSQNSKVGDLFVAVVKEGSWGKAGL